MLYKPKYCCQCGENVERIDWKLWSSRRFCELCETEVGHHDWMPRIALGLGLVLSVFGVGSYLRTPEKSFADSKGQVVNQMETQRNFADVSSQPLKSENESTVETNLDTTSRVEKPTKQVEVGAKVIATQNDHLGHSELPQNDQSDPVYFCGAKTKKGSPCSRRVKGGGRCWQHKGREAMLAPKDLVADK